ncbi:MAG: undecaprenyl/decaprenyl-phosphate alpha-N-acetylglucosaminyl 1-phosphate transferase [Firmicutes bacterium]|nr:undecaprenyl/decaprenyl-phosphate alpha-N-acetylglucosaminyl 1-phosphate transferase [Bacillota bacterium]
MADLYPLLTTFGVALAGAAILTPVAEKVAIKFGAIDKPNARKVHKAPIPLWGGLAIAFASIIAVLVSLGVFESLRHQINQRMASNLIGILIGGIIILIVGMIDDKIAMPAKVKLAFQILVAVILIKFGVVIQFLTIPGIGFVVLPVWAAWGVTIFWIVGLTNAINLMDGLDGLLAGASTIFALLFFIVALLKGQYVVALLMMALAGACLGFLKFNFNPARIFMGDTGSLFLGLMFSSLSIMGALKVTTTAAVIVPLLIMGLPVLDTSFAIVRRFLNGKPIFSPDKEHVHHQLLALGLSHKQAVLYIYLICGTLGAIGLSLVFLVR